METPNATMAATKPLLVTVPHALQIVQIGRTKLYELIGEGKIKTTKIGARTLVSYASLEAIASGEAA